MNIIQLLEYSAAEKENHFSFYVNYADGCSRDKNIIWEYKDGRIEAINDEETIFYYLDSDTYHLHDKIVIIEEVRNRLPDIEVNKNYISIDGKQYTATVSIRKLALVLKDVIEEVRELKGEKNEN